METTSDDLLSGISFDNSYARLPDRFFARLDPAPVRAPRLVKLNHGLCEVLGLDADDLTRPTGIAALAGNAVPEGAAPLAMAYAGHQFGGWSPQLGDGRAILLGEVIDRNGQRRDIQLKGSGRTPFSRGGDGRAPLGPVLREYIVSEAMAALGVPTTRALAAVMTGETVVRDYPFPGAVLTRVASSHIRVGTFQFFAAREDVEGLRQLADHVIARHYPHVAEAADPYGTLLDAVIARQAGLVAQWMGLGFIHGVMNTDNMTISGETIDFGPCAFMDTYHPETVFSSIDQFGRYAYANQPRVAQWNLACLAQSLLPLMAGDEAAQLAAAQASVDAFVGIYEAAWLDVMRPKLGLTAPQDGDKALIEDLLATMAAETLDFTRTFRALSDGIEIPQLRKWQIGWQVRLGLEVADDGARAARMRASSPRYIPRNHRVEEAIAAGLAGDFTPFERLVDVLAAPFDDQPANADFALPPEMHQIVHQTFCGT